MNYLSSLNEAQRRAVECLDGPSLVLAGAGSGKTRVLTHRIAHLIFQRRVALSEILAVTFTNKAAAEMRSRVMALLGDHPYLGGRERELWVSTFHSSCVRILRSDIHYLGYENTFTIYDDADQRSVVKACLKELNLSESAFSPKAIQARINRLKNDGVDAASYEPTFGGSFEDGFIRVFERYSEVLKKSSALDFADLILLTVKLFQNFPRVLTAYQDRFPYYLIDEYQDTNRCQYLLMRLLAGRDNNICAVGDEDQSIYRWRGADISNILNFEKDFPNAQVFKLEQNYRSTKNIIEAASQVISHNTERRDKKLWTDNAAGEKITLVECYDEHDEALKIVSDVHASVSEGHALNQIAVFYRTNAQSRLIEDMLRAKGINYQIYGGLKFYDRLEVKDVLAYLKLISNPLDDVSFRRVVNVPARGIGAKSLEKLAAQARGEGLSLYHTLEKAFGSRPSLQLDVGRTEKHFRQFFTLIDALRSAKNTLLPSDLVNAVLEDSGYRKMLTDENTVESQSRLENLAELRQSVVEFELRSGADKPEQDIRLERFLEEIALVSDIDRFDPEAPSLRLMTIHMAKGLEFDAVIIAGLEEELFPNVRPWEPEDEADIEEERRLFYVGMTRARQKLYLCHAKNRTVFGSSHFRVASRFIEEIPAEYLEVRRADYFVRRRMQRERPGLPRGISGSTGGVPWEKPSPDPFAAEESASEQRLFEAVYESEDELAQPVYEDGFHLENSIGLGSRVLHPLFGEGIVRKSVGRDKLIVEFAGRGLKKISLRFTQLKPL